jgi:hypothetical protein
MKKYLSVFFVFLASCGSQVVNKTNKIDAELQPYVDSFELYSGIQYMGTADLSPPEVIQFYNENAVGVCIVYKNGDKEIKIDNEYWEISSLTVKEQLIFHELGHCALMRNHNSEFLTLSKDDELYNAPQSIMYPYTFGGPLYTILRDYYMQELINEENALTEITL